MTQHLTLCYSETFHYISVEIAWADKTRHKMFKCSFYSPSVLFKVDFGRMQNVIELLFKDDVALLTSPLSSSPAVVRNASILNLRKFVFICWCECYLTIKSTNIPLVSCIRAFKGLTFIKNVDIYAPVEANDQIYEQGISSQQPSHYFASMKMFRFYAIFQLTLLTSRRYVLAAFKAR